MKRRNFLQSLNNAVEGFIYVVKTERNMRVHYLLGSAVLFAGIFLHLSLIEWVVVCSVTSLVWVTEMINTAIEETLDMLEGSTHQSVRIIKDISAGAVLVSAFNALVVGFFIFSKHLTLSLESIYTRVRYTSWDVLFVALLAAIFIVVFLKAWFQRGTPFRGGIVSGHSAVAFSLWTVTLFTQRNVFVITATLFLALLVAQSRLRAKIHSFAEVAGGAAIGFLITAIFFHLFK